MLRHPFFGVVVPQAGDAVHHDVLHDAALGAAATGRRTFLGRVATLVAGAAALLLGRSSGGQEQRIEGAASSPGGLAGQAMPNRGGYTTQALGEEGSAYPPPTQPSHPPPGVVTTYAVGEEAGWYRRPPYPTYPPPGTVTTFAVGEEAGYGSGGTYRPRRYYYRPPKSYYYRY